MASIKPSDLCDACQNILRSHEFGNVIESMCIRELYDSGDKSSQVLEKMRSFGLGNVAGEDSGKFPFLLYGEMVSSSEKGCAMCSFLLVTADRQLDDVNQGEQSPLPNPLSPDIQLYYEFRGNGINGVPDLMVGMFEREFAGAGLYLATERQIQNFNQRRAHPHRNLRSCTIDQISHWIDDCEKSHKECNKAPDLQRRTNELKPRRLVCAQDDTTVSLQETATLSGSTKYATLSHCWGSEAEASIWRETKISQDGVIDMTTAPKVLQDAVKLIRALHIDYLWVDALCIDQSSRNDWRVESAKMGDIYLESYLNISATAAENGSEGLFHNTDTLERLIFEIQHQDSLRHVLLSNSTWESFDEHIHCSRLNGRGWVLQERLLSPRILHFSKGEVFWECNTSQSGETMPSLESRYGGLGSLKSLYLRIFTHSRASVEPTLWSFRDDVYRRWRQLVSIYSQRCLTKPSDKLVAILGLADRVAKHLEIPMSSFVAGLWKESLYYSLLWHVDGTRSFPDRAPSWSWARWDGKIEFGHEHPKDNYHARIVATDLQHSEEGGGNKDTLSIVLKGPLGLLDFINTRKQISEEDDPELIDYFDQSLAVEAWRLQWDDRKAKIATDKPHFALLMVTQVITHWQPDERVRRCSGLVLTPTGIKRSQFERVGHFQLPTIKPEALLMRCKDPSEIPKEMYTDFDRDGFEIELV